MKKLLFLLLFITQMAHAQIKTVCFAEGGALAPIISIKTNPEISAYRTNGYYGGLGLRTIGKGDYTAVGFQMAVTYQSYNASYDIAEPYQKVTKELGYINLAPAVCVEDFYGKYFFVHGAAGFSYMVNTTGQYKNYEAFFVELGLCYKFIGVVGGFSYGLSPLYKDKVANVDVSMLEVHALVENLGIRLYFSALSNKGHKEDEFSKLLSQ